MRLEKDWVRLAMSFNDEWEEVKLGDVAEYSRDRINIKKINLNKS